MTCEQCKNPSLKGIHTCQTSGFYHGGAQAANPYAEQYSHAQAALIARTMIDDRLSALKALMSLSPQERDRVLKAIGL